MFKCTLLRLLIALLCLLFFKDGLLAAGLRGALGFCLGCCIALCCRFCCYPGKALLLCLGCCLCCCGLVGNALAFCCSCQFNLARGLGNAPALGFGCFFCNAADLVGFALLLVIVGEHGRLDGRFCCAQGFHRTTEQIVDGLERFVHGAGDAGAGIFELVDTALDGPELFAGQLVVVIGGDDKRLGHAQCAGRATVHDGHVGQTQGLDFRECVCLGCGCGVHSLCLSLNR